MANETVLAASFIVSLLAVVVIYPIVRKFLIRVRIIDIDQQKKDKPVIPTSAGILAMTGILAGLFFYIGVNTFMLNADINLAYVFAGAFSILIITLVGFFDDIATSPIPNQDKGLMTYRVGIKQWQKALLTLPAAIPLMVVKAGATDLVLPIVGLVDFGIFYALLLVPLAVLCVSNATNMLAGMNGLEAGMGFIATLSLGIYATLNNYTEAAMISFVAAGSLLAIFYWNKYPAKILPGDSLTYLIGAVIVTAVVLGNMEKFGIIVFTPWIIESFLKLRSKFKARSLGDLQADGTLKPPYKGIYSLTHIIMKIRPMKEWQVLAILLAFEVVVSVAAFGFSFAQRASV